MDCKTELLSTAFAELEFITLMMSVTNVIFGCLLIAGALVSHILRKETDTQELGVKWRNEMMKKMKPTKAKNNEQN